jgi:hypothetical protein
MKLVLVIINLCIAIVSHLYFGIKVAGNEF